MAQLALDTPFKTCLRCERYLPLDAFHLHACNKRDGRRPDCKECRNAFNRSQYHGTPEERARAAERTRKWRLKNEYGVTLEDYEQMMEDARCEICGVAAPEDGRLCIDHDHKTGLVRGVLCASCNLALGNLRDNPSLAAAAASYLLRKGDDLSR